jgi:hypothetical protein
MHETWFMEDGVGDVMHILEIQGHKFEYESLRAKSTKDMILVVWTIVVCFSRAGCRDAQPARTPS